MTTLALATGCPSGVTTRPAILPSGGSTILRPSGRAARGGVTINGSGVDSKSTSPVSSPGRTSTNRVGPGRPGVIPGKIRRGRETIPCTTSRLGTTSVTRGTTCGELPAAMRYVPAGRPPIRYSPASSVSASYVVVVVRRVLDPAGDHRAPTAGAPLRSSTRPQSGRSSRQADVELASRRRWSGDDDDGGISRLGHDQLRATTLAARSRSVLLRRSGPRAPRDRGVAARDREHRAHFAVGLIAVCNPDDRTPERPVVGVGDDAAANHDRRWLSARGGCRPRWLSTRVGRRQNQCEKKVSPSHRSAHAVGCADPGGQVNEFHRRAARQRRTSDTPRASTSHRETTPASRERGRSPRASTAAAEPRVASVPMATGSAPHS